MASAVNALKVISDVPQQWKCTVMLLLELWSFLRTTYLQQGKPFVIMRAILIIGPGWRLNCICTRGEAPRDSVSYIGSSSNSPYQ